VTARLRRTPRRVKTLLVVSTLLALTACGPGQAGAAAVIGSQKISHDTVNRLARALCSANLGGARSRGETPPDVATKGARISALQVLVESRLSMMFGERRGAEPDPQLLAQAVQQNELGVQLLPQGQREDFRQALRDFAEGQLLLIDVGRSSLLEQGAQEVSDQEALAEGQRLRTRFVRSLDVHVDPRYGTFAEGTVQPGGAELSFPVSESAKQAGEANLAPSYVADLPASQKCR